jgi:hypothetical protein
MRYLLLLTLIFAGCTERVVVKESPPRVVEKVRVVEKPVYVRPVQPRPIVVVPQPRPKPGVHIHFGPNRESEK